MPVIGTFTAIKDGYAGTIRTLNLNSKVEILANDLSEGDRAPQYRILIGATEIGAAWRKTKRGSEETYLSVMIDDPCLPEPILAVLLEATGSGSARLLWRRNRKGS
ncbi:MAG TPA: DUF736 domain-containing protein [Hyphomicrobiaceae bacterium]|jgi:uncharacterized protein (DUF736 family)|nr:DUF736 domain-containing protein [Hyphomicrobiaceae bacterium]